MSNEPEIEVEATFEETGKSEDMLAGYRLFTDRTNMLLGRWLEAIQIVSEPEDMIILDSLRHAVKMTIADTTHDVMLRAVSIAIATQFASEETGAE